MSFVLHAYRRAVRHARTPHELIEARARALRILTINHGEPAVQRHLPAIQCILDAAEGEVVRGR